MSGRRLQHIAERAARTGAAMAERAARPVAAECEDLRGRVIREDEWLDPGLARRRAAGAVAVDVTGAPAVDKAAARRAFEDAPGALSL